MHFGPEEVLVPGASSYRPIAVALGIIGMYGTVLVLVSSWVRRHYSPKVWRALHIAAVPAFILAMLHGIFAGADTTRRWMFLMYMLTASVVVFLLILRGLTVGLRPARAAQSSPAPRVSRSDSRAGSEEPVGPEPIGCRRRGASPRSRMAGCSGPPSRPPRYFLPRVTSTGTETRIGEAGSVSRVPATANAPATSDGCERDARDAPRNHGQRSTEHAPDGSERRAKARLRRRGGYRISTTRAATGRRVIPRQPPSPARRALERSRARAPSPRPAALAAVEALGDVVKSGSARCPVRDPGRPTKARPPRGRADLAPGPAHRRSRCPAGCR